MNPVDKKARSLGYIAGFLLLSNIIMLVFFIGINDSKKNVHIKENHIGNFLKNEIGFDDKQMEQYQLLKKSDLDSMKPYFTALRASKDSFYRFVTVPTSDSDIKEQSRKIGQSQIEVDNQMLIHFKKVRNLCRTDQLPKFDSLFKNVIGKITTGKMKKNYKE